MLTTLLLIAALDGPITASIPRHAAELAVQSPGGSDDWSALQQIMRGKDIVLRTRTMSDRARVFVAVDTLSMTVLNLQDPALPPHAADRLKQIALLRPHLFDSETGFVEDDLRVGQSGVFVGDTRVCDLDRVVERVARDEVTLVKTQTLSEPSTRALAIGAVIGFVVGGAVALNSAFNCNVRTNAGFCTVGITAVFWVPPAGAAIGYWGSRHVVERTYYRRD